MTSQTHKSPFRDSPRPELVPEEDHLEAIQLLLPQGAQISDAMRFQSYARQNMISLDWMWTVRDPRRKPASTLLAVPSPGRTVMLFTSDAGTHAQHDRIRSLLDNTLDFLKTREIDLVQSLLMVNDATLKRAFQASGFKELAILQYMDRVLPKRTPSHDLPDKLIIRTYDDSKRNDLIQALDQSYKQTLDCPALRGLRRTDDVIKGHQSTGEFDPDLWSIAYRDDEPVGAILINRSLKKAHAELVYVGVGPEVRGLGWGKALLKHGTDVAIEADLGTLSLAVDLDNTPALSLYDSMGFIPTGRRRAVIRSLL